MKNALRRVLGYLPKPIQDGFLVLYRGCLDEMLCFKKSYIRARANKTRKNQLRDIIHAAHGNRWKNVAHRGNWERVLRSCDQAKTRILVFDHDLGGGATHALNHYIEQNVHETCFFVVRHKWDEHYFSLDIFFEQETIEPLCFFDIRDLRSLQSFIKFDEIIINELVRYTPIQQIIDVILTIKNTLMVPLVVMLHDFYMICPTGTLMNHDKQWCNLPDQKTCSDCYKKLTIPLVQSEKITSIQQWRVPFFPLLKNADKIVHFSQFTRSIVERVFPEIPFEKYHFKKMPVTYLRKVERQAFQTRQGTHIVMLGTCVLSKGARIFYEMAQMIQNNPQKYQNVKLFVFGYQDPNWAHPLIQVTGTYRKENLPEMMEEYHIDLIFIPSVAPETYSLTTQEAIEMNMPVAVFNLGAPPERVRQYAKGLVVDKISSDCMDELIAFVKRLRQS